jgi:hypothetical protein
MWDSADDWCHYHGRVVEAIAQHTLFSVAQARMAEAAAAAAAGKPEGLLVRKRMSFLSAISFYK